MTRCLTVEREQVVPGGHGIVVRARRGLDVPIVIPKKVFQFEYRHGGGCGESKAARLSTVGVFFVTFLQTFHVCFFRFFRVQRPVQNDGTLAADGDTG